MDDKLLRLVAQLSVVSVLIYIFFSAIGRKDVAAIINKTMHNLPGTGGKWTMGKGATPAPTARPIPVGTVIL